MQTEFILGLLFNLFSNLFLKVPPLQYLQARLSVSQSGPSPLNGNRWTIILFLSFFNSATQEFSSEFLLLDYLLIVNSVLFPSEYCLKEKAKAY